MVSAKGLKTNYHSEITAGEHKYIADARPARGGTGEYPRPGDFLAVTLAACMNITMRQILDKRGISYTNVETLVDLDRSVPDVTTFKSKFIIDGDIDDATREDVISEAENCAICNILRGEKKFERMD